MTLTTRSGQDAALFQAYGSNSSLTDITMVEVDLTARGYPAHTVYELPATYRYLDDDVVPVFQADTAGNGTFVAVTPAIQQFGRIFLSTPRGATDVVRCHSGNYLTLVAIAGATNFKVSADWKTESKMLLGYSVPYKLLLYKEWSVTFDRILLGTSATLTTGMTGSNNDITLTHEPGGAAGDLISLQLDDPGTTNTLDISVSGQAIVVTLGYASGAINTTASALVNALNSSPAVLALGVTARVKTGDTGAGLVTVLAHTHLSGGLDPSAYSDQDTKVIIVLFSDEDAEERWEGWGVLPKVDTTINSDSSVLENVTVEPYGPLFWMTAA